MVFRPSRLYAMILVFSPCFHSIWAADAPGFLAARTGAVIIIPPSSAVKEEFTPATPPATGTEQAPEGEPEPVVLGGGEDESSAARLRTRPQERLAVEDFVVKRPGEDEEPIDDDIPANDEPVPGLNPKNLEFDDSPLGIIGEVEPIYIEDFSQPFQARIDTGASQCSLDAGDVRRFERDGKPWVSFTIQHRETGEAVAFERRVKRIITIRASNTDVQERPLVEMKIRLGPLTLLRDFTLTDRSGLKYQALIGRNLLTGLAVVDVSRVNTLAQ